MIRILYVHGYNGKPDGESFQKLAKYAEAADFGGEKVEMHSFDYDATDPFKALRDLRFYYFKNESEDRFSDDDLIEFMEKVFNGQAHGSTEVLTTISLEELCRWARNDFDERYADEEAFW